MVLIVSKTSKYRGCEAIVADTFLYRNQVGVYPKTAGKVRRPQFPY